MAVAVSVLLTQILVIGVIQAAYAFYPMPSPEVYLDLDRSSGKGFESIGGTFDTPVFVLKRGNTGTVSITLSSKENETVHVTLSYEGDARLNYRVWSQVGNIPDGITYSIEPSGNITLAPNSSVTETIQISAAPDTAIRSYNLSLYLVLKEEGDRTIGIGYSTTLTIVDGGSSSSSSLTNTTTSNAKSTTTYVTHSTTFTSTTTTTETILNELTADSSTYAWAVGATVVAAVLAIVALRRRS